MSAAVQDCCTTCPDPQVVQIPGSPGQAGADGTNGQNAFTFTTASFVVPAIGSNVTVSVGSSAWVTLGQNLFVEGAGMFEVISFPSAQAVVLKYLDYTGNTNAGATISAGAQVSPGATEPSLGTPWSIANGGTGATTKTDARSELGIGQDITQKFVDNLAYDVTNAYATITSMSMGLSVSGLYLFQGAITIAFTGVTFAASRDISMRIRDVTNNVTLTDKTIQTGIQTTTTFPAIDYILPVKTGTVVAPITVELQIFMSVVESAGSTVVTDAYFSATPLALGA